VNRLLFLSVYCLGISTALTADCGAQQGNGATEIGLVSYGSYHGGDIDQVDLKSGNLFAKIPLFSLPQMGKLSLSMSMVINDSGFSVAQSCETWEVGDPGGPTEDETDCYPYYYRASAVGPTLVLDQDLGISFSSMEFSANNGEETAAYFNSSVTDASGASHTMGYDPAFASTQVQHATDGSGYTYIPDATGNSIVSIGTIYAPSGLQYVPVANTNPQTGVVTYSKSIVDPQIASSTQNKITYSGGIATSYGSADFPGAGWQGCSFFTTVSIESPYQYEWGDPPMNCPNPGAITDSLGRQIPLLDPTQISTNSASINAVCPNLNVANQPATGVQTWSVPGPNSGTSTYTFCYTTITYSTDFWGGGSAESTDPNPQGSLSAWQYYEDAIGTGQVVQSIILPNGTSWGFVYDSIGTPARDGYGNLEPCPSNPNWGPGCPSPIAYGDVLKIIRPTGGSTSYTYTTPTGPNANSGSNVCQFTYGLAAPVRMVNSRTVNDANGNSSTWTYSWMAPTAGTFYVRVSNPAVQGDQSYTDHYFTDYSGSNTCVLGENLTQTLDGATYNSSTQMDSGGTLLKSVQTQFTVNANVGYAGWPDGYAQVLSVLPHTVQTSVATASGLALSDTTTYGYSSMYNEAYGEEENAQPFGVGSTVVATIPYEKPTSTLFQGADGTLKESLTSYAWQSAPETTQSSFENPSVNMIDAVASTCILPSQASNPGAGCSPVLGSTTSATQYIYGDSNSPYNLVSQQQLLAGNWLTTKSMTYDPLERVTSTMDANGNTTHILAYEIDSSTGSSTPFPSQIQRPLMPVEQYSYDPNTGNLLSYIDVNSKTTTYQYDVEGRRTLASYPDNGSTSYCYTDTGGSYCAQVSSPPYSLVTVTAASPDPSLVTQTLYDGLGRVVEIRSGLQAVSQSQPTPTTGVTNYTDTGYDALGRVASATNPYFSISDPTYGVTKYTYDVLNRKVIQMQPDNSIMQWCYNGLQTDGQANCLSNQSSISATSWVDTTDEAGNHSQQVSDALGNLRAVMSQNPTGTNLALETDYGYDVLGNLWTVNQAGLSGETPRNRSFTYDSLSRLITSTNPEAGTICYGQWIEGSCQGGYDPNGNLLYKTDARGVIASIGYDALNHVLSTTYSNDPALSPSTCYQYATSSSSSSANSIGRLIAEWTQGHGTNCSGAPPSNGILTERTVQAYDQMGRMQQSTQCVLGNCTAGGGFSLSQSYDIAGKVLTWSDGVGQFTFNQTFDNSGRLQSLTASSGSPPSQVTLFSTQNPQTNTTNCGAANPPSYSPTGALQNWTLGNDLNVVRNFDSRLRVTCETASVP